MDDDHDELRESVRQYTIVILAGITNGVFKLFSKTKLIDRIVHGDRANKEIEAKPHGVRRAYMGHLLTIAEKLKEAAEHDDIVRQHLACE